MFVYALILFFVYVLMFLCSHVLMFLHSSLSSYVFMFVYVLDWRSETDVESE